ncbi:GON domain-containing protein [Ditylenchus destructor]|nr:GON domain-containing protein [Ditylenchus destructor]
MSPSQRAKQDGGWGEWKPWKDCSRTCGGGIQKAERDCDSPRPNNGGKYCLGQRVRYRSCNIQECPYDTIGFREMQCSEFDGRDVKIHGVPNDTKWVPKYTGISENERCSLYCQASNSAAFYLLKEKVLDGTTCDRNSDDICIDGVCHKAGCDHRLGSDMKRDICGICGGDSKSCTTMQGTYNERGSFGYNEVLKIPAGSANIDIRQSAYNDQKDDDNYLGPLRTDVYLHILSVGNLNPPNIHYKYMVSNKASSPQQVAKFKFSYVLMLSLIDMSEISIAKKFQNPTLTKECVMWTASINGSMYPLITSKMPMGHTLCVLEHTRMAVKKELMMRNVKLLVLHVLLPGIVGTVTIKGFAGLFLNGASVRNHVGPKELVEEVPTVSIPQTAKLIIASAKELHVSPPIRNATEFLVPSGILGHGCSRSCGGGLRIRLAQCQDASGRDVSGELCPVSEKVDREKCNEHLCKQWKFGSWSQCSVSCGIGIEKRDARCVDQNGQVLGDDQCAPQERIVEKQCTEPACPHWKMSSWSSCSVSCMDGFETRSVTCVDGNDRKLPDQRCLKKVTCGTGVREREVECIYREQIVDDSLCPDRQRPLKQEQCVLLSCAQWKTEPWGTCSVSCGMGIQRRTVHCTRTGINQRSIVFYDTECQAHKPKTERDCERMPCPILPRKNDSSPEKSVSSIHWGIGSWGDCSKTCGRGIQRRLVQCRDQIRLLPAEYCRHLKTVISEQECELSSCFEWTVGPWEKCNATCGEHATQRRRISCDPKTTGGAPITNNNVENAVTDKSKCDLAKKPVDTRKCDVPACPPPANPKTSCSATCGGGWRRRSVYCSKSRCPESEKPSMFEQCNTKPCRIGQWRMGPWTHCSVTCGDGVQTRKVWCQSDINVLQTLEDSECDVSERPIPLRNCSRSSCSVLQRTDATSLNDNSTQMQNIAIDSQIENNLVNDDVLAGSYNWIPGQWSPCSQTCGRGIRTRTVKCVDSTGAEVSHSKCDISLRPLQQHKCRQAHCPRWHANKWSTCSATCGSGISRRDIVCKKGRTEVPDSLCAHQCIDPCKATEQGRRVYCMSNANKRASNKMCNSTLMPATKRKCLVTQCPYEWMPGPWSTSRMCLSLEKPQVSKECKLGPCGVDASYRWSVGPWSHCSKSCGPGFRKRKIRCMDKTGERISRELCEQTKRPRRREPCFVRNCLPNDCAELRAQNTTVQGIDGNYTYFTENLPQCISTYEFCRLSYPYSCPYEGRRNDSCACTNDGHASNGLSRFRKLRIDLHNMKINPNDFTFAHTEYGNPVPFGSAGDCYSMSECPQGRFSIDLRLTGLRVVDDLQWVDQGYRTSSRIERKENNALIEGQCGGYCGECAPDRFKGLVIEVDLKQKPSVGVG